MDSLLDELKKEEEFYKELRRLSQPGFSIDDPKEGEEWRNVILPFLYKNSSLFDRSDQEEKDCIFLSVVGEPLRRTFVFWARNTEPPVSAVLTEKDKEFLESVTEPHNSLELFTILEKMGSAPFGRQFCYKLSKLNPALQTKVERVVAERNIEGFEQILLEYYDQIKTFICVVIQVKGLIDLKELGNVTLSEEQLKFLQDRVSRKLAPLVQSENTGFILRMQRIIRILKYDEDTPFEEIIGWYKDYYRFVTCGYLSGEIVFVSDTEKEIFERLMNHPLFPELYNECKHEVETKRAGLNQGVQDVTKEGIDPNDKPKKRRKPSTWLSDEYSMYSDTHVGILLRAKIWPTIKKDLSFLPLPNNGLKRMEGDINSIGAALLFYVFKQLGIASEDATYGRSFERTMVAMGTESNVLQKNKFSAGPFARNSTTPHLEAISIVLPALCQLKEGKHLDIAKIQAKGSDLVKVLVNGHTTLMDAYQYLINKLPSIFEESSDNPANNTEAGSD